jgi:anti-anti-sigma factor
MIAGEVGRMSLDISTLDGTRNGLRIRGDVDMESVGKLNEFIQSLGSPSHPIVIDASGVQFMDSSGLHVLLKLAAQSDGHLGLILRNPSRPVRRLLQMALPDGMDGMAVEFSGAGPGAAHRLAGLIDITAELHRMTSFGHIRSAFLRDAARRERFRRVLLRA